jgi:hypothetical protein
VPLKQSSLPSATKFDFRFRSVKSNPLEIRLSASSGSFVADLVHPSIFLRSSLPAPLMSIPPYFWPWPFSGFPNVPMGAPASMFYGYPGFPIESPLQPPDAQRVLAPLPAPFSFNAPAPYSIPAAAPFVGSVVSWPPMAPIVTSEAPANGQVSNDEDRLGNQPILPPRSATAQPTVQPDEANLQRAADASEPPAPLETPRTRRGAGFSEVRELTSNGHTSQTFPLASFFCMPTCSIALNRALDLWNLVLYSCGKCQGVRSERRDDLRFMGCMCGTGACSNFSLIIMHNNFCVSL